MRRFEILLLVAIVIVLIAINITNIMLANDSSTNLLLEKAITNFSIPPRGVIHVGASEAEEEPVYKKHNIPYVLWVEADPKAAEKLEKRLSKKPGISVATFAASDENGFHEFIRTNNQVSSSLLEPHENLQKLHPQIQAAEKIQIKTQKLDDYLISNPDRLNYNIMVLDIQGAELLALKGATNTLKQIDCIISEIQYDQLYKDSVLVSELDAFLLAHDFIRADTGSSTMAWGDALYVKKSFLSIDKS